MKLIFIFIYATLILISGCKAQVSKKTLIVNHVLTLYNGEQQVAYIGKTKIWQYDSLFIQQVYISKSLITSKGTTREYLPKFCRFMDIRNRTYYDFSSFSDTAQCIGKSNLPDSYLVDGGYPVHVNKRMEFINEPVIITDSVVDNKVFHRIRFNMKGKDPLQVYSVGLFLKGQNFGLLSLESSYSQSKDWFLSKKIDYDRKTNLPLSVTEMEFLADTLSPTEQRVFDAWEEYARKNPVVQ